MTIRKNSTIEQVRDAVTFKLLSMHIIYRYGNDAETNKDIYWEVNEDQKVNHVIYTLEYKASRRTISFDEFNLHLLPKDEDMLIYKPGQKTLNVGIELIIEYQDDREKRSGNNALKIYSD